MSKVLSEFDWSRVSTYNPQPRRRFYEWDGSDGYFNGQIWELTPGEDFDGPAHSMASVVRTTANRKKVKVRVRVVPSSTSLDLISDLRDKAEKARGKSMALDLDTVRALLDLAEGGGDSTVVLQKHADTDLTRRTTKSPSTRSVRAAAKAESTNGEKPKPTKKAAAKAPARKAAASKAPPTKKVASKKVAAKKVASKRRLVAVK